MSEAITWANSDSPKSRELASFLLADIGTPDATEYLKTLSHDSDNGVAELAGLQLGKGRPRRPHSSECKSSSLLPDRPPSKQLGRQFCYLTAKMRPVAVPT